MRHRCGLWALTLCYILIYFLSLVYILHLGYPVSSYIFFISSFCFLLILLPFLFHITSYFAWFTCILSVVISLSIYSFGISLFRDRSYSLMFTCVGCQASLFYYFCITAATVALLFCKKQVIYFRFLCLQSLAFIKFLFSTLFCYRPRANKPIIDISLLQYSHFCRPEMKRTLSWLQLRMGAICPPLYVTKSYTLLLLKLNKNSNIYNSWAYHKPWKKALMAI